MGRPRMISGTMESPMPSVLVLYVGHRKRFLSLSDLFSGVFQANEHCDQTEDYLFGGRAS